MLFKFMGNSIYRGYLVWGLQGSCRKNAIKSNDKKYLFQIFRYSYIPKQKIFKMDICKFLQMLFGHVIHY